MKFFSIALSLLALASFGSAQKYENVEPNGQTVTFWHQHTRGRQEALDKIVADFNATNPYGITVVAENQGGYGDIFNKMINLIGTSDLPNLVVAYQNQAATYQLANGLIDMTPLIESPRWGLSEEDKEDFFASYLAQDLFPTFDGARLGFPPNRSLEVMYYNMDWLNELGYAAPPATPAEFEEVVCKAAERPFSGATSEGSTGYEISIDASRFASWVFAFGGNIFDYDTNQYSLNNAKVVAAMQFLQDLYNKACINTVSERYGDQSDFGAGTSLFTVGSSSGLPYYKSAVTDGADFTWSVTSLPRLTEEPVMNLYGASVSMPDVGTLEQQLAAWLFLKYYTGVDAQSDWVQASNYFPVRKSVAVGLDNYIAENPAYGTAFELLGYTTTEPPVPGYDFVRDMMEEALVAIIADADVQETLDQLNEDANESLADQLDQ